ncbi:MAG: hypothetical protein PUP93_08170 [Rhizonema sp. NSF051]|nr:hypothetical protein [Rhizonema sp. NSF051]
MRTDFDYPQKSLVGPVVFRPDFNNFKSITVNQAWSLFFTAGQEDKALGIDPELGKFFTYVLVAVGVTGSIWAIAFSRFASVLFGW